jgi:hypothetical protein
MHHNEDKFDIFLQIKKISILEQCVNQICNTQGSKVVIFKTSLQTAEVNCKLN